MIEVSIKACCRLLLLLLLRWFCLALRPPDAVPTFRTNGLEIPCHYPLIALLLPCSLTPEFLEWMRILVCGNAFCEDMMS